MSNSSTFLRNVLDNWIIIYYNVANWQYDIRDYCTMIIKTRVFELANSRYQNLTDLAKAMGISVSQVYRVREGKRGINEKFIVGAKKAFPESRLDELFYFKSGQSSGHTAQTTVISRYNHIVQQFTGTEL
jgi:hypothetical protein